MGSNVPPMTPMRRLTPADPTLILSPLPYLPEKSTRAGPSSPAHLPRADDPPRRRRQRLQPHGSASVQLLGRDPDLRAQAKLRTIGKPRRGVDRHRCRVHTGTKPLDDIHGRRHDRLRVTRGVTIDVREGTLDAIDKL